MRSHMEATEAETLKSMHVCKREKDGDRSYQKASHEKHCEAFQKTEGDSFS